MLWSERCGADWPCDVFVASKCAPLVHNLYLGKWKKLNHMKEIVSEVCHKLILNFLLTFKSFQSDFGSFQLLPSDRKKNIYIFFIDTPPGSSVLIKVIPTLENFLTKFKVCSKGLLSSF
jgi:hypothetical protein